MHNAPVLKNVSGVLTWVFANGRELRFVGGGAPTLEELTTERGEVIKEAEDIISGLNGASPEGEKEERLRALTTRNGELNVEIDKAKELTGLVGDFAAARQQHDADEEAARNGGRPAMYGGPTGTLENVESKVARMAITPGEQFVASEPYQEWIGRFPSGGPSINTQQAQSQAFDVGVYRHLLGLVDATSRLRGTLTPEVMRSLVTSNDASAGELVLSLRRGLLEPGLTRPLTIRDLVTVIPVTTDTIEYVREKSRISNAAPVEEATALTGTSGTKPEGGLEFEAVADHVRTIAEWVAATKRILADAGELRSYIDGYLADDLALELEDQMVAGGGTGEDFLGILNNPDIQTQNGATGTQNILDVIRFAKRKVRVNARTNPSAVVINPEDLELIDTLKAGAGAAGDGGGAYYGSNPFQFTGNTRLWGMPLVESEAIPPGTALVGDFKRAVLFDREATSISVGTAGDDFIRNIVRVLAELRAGFGLIRPTAFCTVDLT